MAFKYSYYFSEKEEQDFNEILQYITFELCNPKAAQRLGKKIFEKIDIIRSFPELGPIADNENFIDNSIRKVSIDNYILFYKIHKSKQTIFILRILYSKRNIHEIMKILL